MPVAGEWVELFDGATLSGWTQRNGTATYEVVDGAIIGTTSARSPNSFLCSDRFYGDTSSFDVKLFDDQLNSGVRSGATRTPGSRKAACTDIGWRWPPTGTLVHL